MGSIAIGMGAGSRNQGTGAVALGIGAGNYTQGSNSIAIGTYSGYTGQASNSIIINASGTQVDNTISNSCIITPIRDSGTGSNKLFYNSTSGEITYGPTIQYITTSNTAIDTVSPTTIISADVYGTFTMGTGASNIFMKNIIIQSQVNSSFSVSYVVSIGNILYVGGTFTSIGGISANRIASYNISTNTWSNPFGTGLNNTCFALATIGSMLYVGGIFTTVNTVNSWNRIAAFNTITSTWSNPFGTGLDNNCNALLSIGHILHIAGNFTTANGVSSRMYANFNTLSNTWTTIGTALSGGSFQCYALTNIGSMLYIGGGFTVVNGTTGPGVAAYNTITNSWTNPFGVGLTLSSTYCRSLTNIGNILYVGGDFTAAGGSSANKYLATFNTTANTWSNIGYPTTSAISAQNTLFAIGSILYAVNNFAYNTLTNTSITPILTSVPITAIGNVAYPSNSQIPQPVYATNKFGSGLNSSCYGMIFIGSVLYVVGDFTSPSNRIAAYNLYTNVWSNPFGTGLNVLCRTIVAISSILYVGGDFTSVNGNAWSYLAAFDTSTSTWSNPFGTGLNNSCYILTTIGSIIYVGGTFTQVSGNPYNYIAGFNAIALTWISAYGTGLDDWCYTLKALGSILYVGGKFITVDGVGGYNRLAALDTTTNTWSNPFGTGLNNICRSISIIGTILYIGGDFTTVDTINSWNRIAAFDTITNTWSNPFGTGLNDSCNYIISIGSNLYIGGNFTDQGSKLAAFNTSTSTWISSTLFNASLNNNCRCLTSLAGIVYIGGDFTTFNSDSWNYIANINVNSNKTIQSNFSITGGTYNFYQSLINNYNMSMIYSTSTGLWNVFSDPSAFY